MIEEGAEHDPRHGPRRHPDRVDHHGHAFVRSLAPPEQFGHGRRRSGQGALDAALRKALLPTYPLLAQFDLADYKVHILDGRHGTAATTRVLIDMQNETRRWATVGASTNIIEASWLALADAVEYGLAATQ